MYNHRQSFVYAYNDLIIFIHLPCFVFFNLLFNFFNLGVRGGGGEKRINNNKETLGWDHKINDQASTMNMK